MPSIRVVTEETVVNEQSFDEVAHGALQRILKDQPPVLMMIWQVGDVTKWCSVPSAPAVEEGLNRAVFEIMHASTDF